MSGRTGAAVRSRLRRRVATVTIAAAANGVDTAATVDLGPSYALVAIATSVPARVRLYATDASSAADAARPVTEDPDATVALVMEYVTSGTAVEPIAPTVAGSSSGPAPVRVANLSGATADVAVTFTYLPLES